MPIPFIDYSDTVKVGTVIESFRNETGLALRILENGENAPNETTVTRLQELHVSDVPATFSLRSFRGPCIIDISKSVKDAEELFFERFLLRVRILAPDGKPLKPARPLASCIPKRHPSLYNSDAERAALRERMFRIYSEVWEQIDRARDCLENMKALRKESDTMLINAKVAYWLSDQKYMPIPDDIHTQIFLSTLDNQVFSSTYMNHPDPPEYFMNGLFSIGLTVYDILRLDYRIVLSLEWGTCYKSQQTGLGIRI